MRTSFVTASDRSEGAVGLALGLLLLAGLLVLASPRSTAQTAVVQVAWNWPESGWNDEPHTWASTSFDTLEWWLGLSIPRPAEQLERRGNASVEINELTREWTVRYGKSRLEGERVELHRRALPPPVPEMRVLAEALIDLNGVRRADPQRAGWGSVARWLRLWKLTNAREVMLHFRAVPRNAPLPMVVEVVATWSVRSEPPDRVHAMTLSRPLGPVEAANLVMDGTGWLIAMECDMRAAGGLLLGTAIAARERDEMFERNALRWAVNARDRFTRLDAILGETAYIGGGASGLNALIPLRHARHRQTVFEDFVMLQAVLAQQAESDESERSGSVMIPQHTRLRWWVLGPEDRQWAVLHLAPSRE